jgi:hypothetical protein
MPPGGLSKLRHLDSRHRQPIRIVLLYVCWRAYPLASEDGFKLTYWFQRKFFLNIFPIGSYVKTMSADGGHLGRRSGSQDMILKVYHLRTIHDMLKLSRVMAAILNFRSA